MECVLLLHLLIIYDFNNEIVVVTILNIKTHVFSLNLKLCFWYLTYRLCIK